MARFYYRDIINKTIKVPGSLRVGPANMLGEVLVWCLGWYYFCLEAMTLAFTVLRIKFKQSSCGKSNESKGHLALRLNDGQVLKSANLIELIEYCGSVFGVKYLTVIAGNCGFEREIDLRGHESKAKCSIYNNYEQLYAGPMNPQIHVNLVDNDSEGPFLLKIKETLVRASEREPDEAVYNSALKAFTSKNYSGEQFNL